MECTKDSDCSFGTSQHDGITSTAENEKRQLSFLFFKSPVLVLFFLLVLHHVLDGHPAYNCIQQSPTLLLLGSDFIQLKTETKKE